MPETRACACGCGRNTTRGEFIRGHAITHANALQLLRAGGPGITRPQVQNANRELEWRGWLNWHPVAEGTRKVPSSAYGVEMEFFGMTSRVALEALTEAGVPVEDTGYHHNPSKRWRITHDGSVYAGNGNGNELVSPILTMANDKHFEQTRTAAKALRNKGGDVDKTCGLHVHHSASSMSPVLIAETLAHYAIFQGAIDSILPASRRVGTNGGPDYARGLGNVQDLNGLLRAPGLDMAAVKSNIAGQRQRYTVINLRALNAHDTLEFRQHSGTLHSTKVNNWVKLTKLFMDIGTKHSILELLKAHDFNEAAVSSEYQDIVKVLQYLGAQDSLIEYYLERRDKFSDKKEDDEDKNVCIAYQSRKRAHEAGGTPPPAVPGEWCAECMMNH